MLTLTPLMFIWTAFAAVTLGLALYRKVISAHEHDIVHLAASEAAEIPKQEALAARLGVIDKWGKTLTVVTLVFGLALGSVYLYGIWVKFGTTVRFGS